MATSNVVTGDQFMSIERKLHELTRQLLQKGGYPHDLNMLEVAVQRIVEGAFWPDDDAGCDIEVEGLCASERLERLRLDNFDELCAELEGASLPNRRLGAYAGHVRMVRLNRLMPWKDIAPFLGSRGLEPASFEESCSFLEVNRAAPRSGAIVCMDAFVFPRGKTLFLAFTGDSRRSFVRTLAPIPNDAFTPNVRIFARERR